MIPGPAAATKFDTIVKCTSGSIVILITVISKSIIIVQGHLDYGTSLPLSRLLCIVAYRGGASAVAVCVIVAGRWRRTLQVFGMHVEGARKLIVLQPRMPVQ